MAVVIEWLEFRVPTEYRERYVQVDDQVWTPALQQYPGFISKETWLDAEDLELVVLMIRWRSREEWYAIPEAALAKIEQAFDAALGVPYQLAASRSFQVRRFPVS